MEYSNVISSVNICTTCGLFLLQIVNQKHIYTIGETCIAFRYAILNKLKPDDLATSLINENKDTYTWLFNF